MNDLYLEFVVLPFIVFLVIYFIPTILAKFRKHPSSSAIAALNFFLGWTIIGWIGALIWAYTKSESQQTMADLERNLERLDRVRAANSLMAFKESVKATDNPTAIRGVSRD